MYCDNQDLKNVFVSLSMKIEKIFESIFLILSPAPFFCLSTQSQQQICRVKFVRVQTM